MVGRAVVGFVGVRGSSARRLVAEGVVILFGAREGELRRFDAPSLDELTLTDRLRGAFMQRIERLPESSRCALVIAAAEDTGELVVVVRAAALLALPQDWCNTG